jgi:hypothetical protein
MNSKSTGIWFVIAAGLFIFCFFFAQHLRPPPPPSPQVLPHFSAARVTSIQIDPAGAAEIRASRTNNGWQLQTPIKYPAQSGAINTLLESLQNLNAVLRLSAKDSHEHNVTDVDYGFDNPQFTIIVNTGDQPTQLKVGKKTVLGDQVYLRIIGMEGTLLTDASWLNLLPRSVDTWRDTSLVAAGQSFDWIVLTNGTKTIELRRDPDTQFWQMLQPLQSRANSSFIDQSLLKLQAAQISQFVTDSSQTDFSVYGLQPASLDLWLGTGSNLTASVHFGKTATNDAAGDYIQRDSLNSVGVAAKSSLAPWRSQVNTFRDPFLLEITQPIAKIDVDASEHFTLQRHGDNDWSLVGQKYPADPETVQDFVKKLASLKVSEFFKDVATPVDFEKYGFTANSRQIILRSAGDGTNVATTQIIFGDSDTNGQYVRRADEKSIYRLSAADIAPLQDFGYMFRNRQIWNFSGKDVAQVTIHQNGKLRQIIQTTPDKWALAPGSQGMIASLFIEQTVGGAQNVTGLCQLSAEGWVSPNLTDPDAYGFTTNSLQITLELKNGENHTVEFGKELSRWQTALASVTLDGQRWVFVFPPILYQYVSSYLTIPNEAP